MSNKLFFGLLIVAAGILVGWYVFGNDSINRGLEKKDDSAVSEGTGSSEAKKDTSPRTSLSDSSDQTDKGGVSARTVVTYTDSGFSPSPVTVSKGSIVTFVNESGRGMWVASGLHPTHQLLPGFDQLKPVSRDGVYEYTFDVVGTWQYHNHVRESDVGVVVVTEI